MVTTCGIYLIDKDGKVLICHPTNHPNNLWSIPKGLIDESDADELVAAKRELFEETGIDINALVHKDVVRLPNRLYPAGKKTLTSFIIHIEETIKVIDLHCDSMVVNEVKGWNFPEIDAFAWVSIEEASKLLHNSQIENLKLI